MLFSDLKNVEAYTMFGAESRGRVYIAGGFGVCLAFFYYLLLFTTIYHY